MRILTNINKSELNQKYEDFEHLKNKIEPNLDKFSIPCIKLKEIWVKKNSFSYERSNSYFFNFKQDCSEIEKFEQNIQIYNQMFLKQIQLAFIQNYQLRFKTYEIDLFKQVSLF